MKKSNLIIIIAISTFIPSALADELLTAFSYQCSLIHTLCVAFLAFWWVRVHAIENNIRPAKGAMILTLVINIIGIPYYLFKGFGFRQGGIKVMLYFLVLIACISAYSITLGILYTFNT